MPLRLEKLSAPLQRLDAAMMALHGRLSAAARIAVERWRADAAALQFHLRPSNGPTLTVVLGGTGTGKSTLVNRLVGATVTAASFRRTFTAGPVAVARHQTDIPAGWLGVEHVLAETSALPARGRVDALVMVAEESLGDAAPLVDTPDLDGDHPAHHVQADRAFRWAQRLLFVVTPEKYQMTELLSYYRLARRYETPALFVMNKCEESAVVEDFRRQLTERDWLGAGVFVVARDDAAYEPAAESNLDALRGALRQSVVFDPITQQRGIANRVADVVNDLADRVIEPLREARREIDRLIAALRAMEASPVGVDVNPITQQLQRRLQQRSVLYLIGPQRVLDRVRQVPTMLARLPRATWDWVMRGDIPADLIDPKTPVKPGEPPDFHATLADQFTVVRSRIDDVIRSSPVAAQWLADDADGYGQAMIDPASAGTIADEEIERLKQWLGTRWNATPRDTRMLHALLKYLPGGKKLTQWSEAAPYLLAVALVVHHALFGVDLLVIGGYSLATWLTERLSNEVSSQTRATNRRISERFERLAHEQIDRACQWLDRQAPATKELERLVKLAGELVEGGT
jgi:hypothetical protein